MTLQLNQQRVKAYHKILFPYAYNILGSSEDAKDAIQDVLTHHLASKKEDIDNLKGYLIKGVINQSINIKNKKKRVHYEGDYVWLPEPIATETADASINLKDIVSYSLLVLLEKLNPKERAVFILKEGFGYAHEEISEVLSSTVENSRKLLSRAKAKLHEVKMLPKSKKSNAEETEFLERYINAIRERDIKGLEDMLTEDVVFFADGGNKVNVVKHSATGATEVIDLLTLVYQRFQTSYTVHFSEVNHQTAILYYQESELKACQVLERSFTDGKILRINTIVDPMKLKNIKK